LYVSPVVLFWAVQGLKKDGKRVIPIKTSRMYIFKRFREMQFFIE